jgi:hypothetical protein
VIAAAVLAMAVAIGLLALSLFRPDGLAFVWWSLAADAVAVILLVRALVRRGSRS